MSNFYPLDYYARAIECLEGKECISTVDLQRFLGLGYTGTARVMELLEDNGLVGKHRSGKPRIVIPQPKQKEAGSE